MRAKFINEKFTEDSDPISDMGIGSGYTFETLKPGALLKLKPEYHNLVALTQNNSGQFTDRTGMIIRHNHCLVVINVIPNKDGIKEIRFRRFFSDEDAINTKNTWERTGKMGWGGNSNRMKVSKIQFDRRFNVIERGFYEMKESLDEKFDEIGDPIHDMGIGNPLHRAAAKIQEFAEENGYEFQMEKIGKTDSPVLYVPITPRFEERSSYYGGGVVYITKIKYTITHMGHRGWNKTPFSLRKVFVGYAFVPSREDFILNHPGYKPQDEQFDSWLDWQKEELKRRLKGGGLKQRPLSQHLMGRFAEIHEIIDRINKSIKRETKK